MLNPGIQQWLQQHCDSSDAVSGGVVISACDGPGQATTVAEWPASGVLTSQLASAAEAAVQRARPVTVAPSVRQGDSAHNRLISLPLRQGDRMLGAVALAVQADDTPAVERLFQDLVKASAHVGPSLRDDDTDTSTASAVARVLALQTRLLAYPSLAEGAMAMVTELGAIVGAERIMLGVLDPEIAVLAISHSADFKSEQGLLRLAAAAMQESVDQGARVRYPASAADPARLILAHAELHARTGHTLLTVPLVHDGQAIGALLVEHRLERPPGDRQVALCEGVASAIGPLVALRRAAETPWRRRLAEAARDAWQRLMRRDDPVPKLAFAVALLALAAATLIPVDYRVGAPARIEGAVQRVVAAPFDGFLQRSLVRPGDTVRKGDLLVEMADQDLTLEQRKWESTLTQQENLYAAALARADRAQFVISRGKADEARSELELVRRQLSRTKLVAPIDGVVIKGDLSQSLGSPVQRGDALLTLAPRLQYRLIVEVDERDIGDLRPGQTGHLALASLPSTALALAVDRVTPVSSVHDGRNVFDVEAHLAGASGIELRPGMQGVAKIDAGRQSLAWIWTHRIVDGLRLTWWSWGP